MAEGRIFPTVWFLSMRWTLWRWGFSIEKISCDCSFVHCSHHKIKKEPDNG